MKNGFFHAVARAKSPLARARIFKFACGLLLLPACAGSARSLARIIQITASADLFWVPFLAGGACWVAIYALLPKPIWIYVFGHELTHILWVWIFGGRVKALKVSSKGGHVVITKTNFVISLAPYFFPLYSILVLAGFIAGHAIWGWQIWFPLLYLVLGIAYFFHLTLTVYALRTTQTDVSEHGILFSMVIIWLGNLFILIVALPLLTSKIGIIDSVRWVLSDTWAVIQWVLNRIRF